MKQLLSKNEYSFEIFKHSSHTYNRIVVCGVSQVSHTRAQIMKAFEPILLHYNHTIEKYCVNTSVVRFVYEPPVPGF